MNLLNDQLKDTDRNARRTYLVKITGESFQGQSCWHALASGQALVH